MWIEIVENHSIHYLVYLLECRLKIKHLNHTLKAVERMTQTAAVSFCICHKNIAYACISLLTHNIKNSDTVPFFVARCSNFSRVANLFIYLFTYGI